jgi:PAS domain S-box-containing protein
MAKLSLRKYENQIRIFFILLVLILLIINIVNFYLLSSSRAILIRSEAERAKALTSALFKELTKKRALEILEGKGRLDFPVYSSYLRRLVINNDLLSASILSANGEMLLSSGSYQPRERDKDFERLGEEYLGSLKVGIEVHTGPEEGQIEYFIPVFSAQGIIQGYVKTVYFDPALQRETRNYRILIYSQAAVILIVLVLVIFFGSWIMRPFKALGKAASRLPENVKREWGWGEEPILVEDSFRKVLEKVMEREETLQQIQSGTGGLVESVEAFVERVAREMISGVIYVDREGRIITMNPEGEKILGKTLKEVRGHPIYEEASHIEHFWDLVEDAIKEGKKYSREVITFLSREGRRGHLGLAITPVRGEGKATVGALCILTDLTEIRELQERSQLKSNLAAIGSLSAGIAHEFRNSLAVILGYAKLIGKGRGSDETTDSSRAIIHEVNTSKRMVEDFLAYAKPAKINFARVNLHGLIESLTKDSRKLESFSKIDIKIGGSFSAISGDEALLKQAFTNILKNAAEAYKGKKGIIEIHGEKEEGGRARISFRDFAGGVPVEQVDQIFLPFFSTKEGGTGLGMAIAQKIIISHDGRIEVENRKNQGLTIHVYLPETH